MNKKIKIALNLSLSILVIISIVVFIGYWKPLTVWQYAESWIGYNKPDASAAGKVVFLGDSIAFREDWNVLFDVSEIANFGVGGNTTDDVLGRLDLAISAKPEKLFLVIGINDLLNGKSVEYVAVNYASILDKIKAVSPDTKIYALSLLPINTDIWKTQAVDAQKILAMNEKIKTLVRERGMTYIDLYSSFHGADDKIYRKYSWDGLHPNSHGYAVWKDALIQYIKT